MKSTKEIAATAAFEFFFPLLAAMAAVVGYFEAGTGKLTRVSKRLEPAYNWGRKRGGEEPLEDLTLFTGYRPERETEAFSGDCALLLAALEELRRIEATGEVLQKVDDEGDAVVGQNEVLCCRASSRGWAFTVQTDLRGGFVLDDARSPFGEELAKALGGDVPNFYRPPAASIKKLWRLPEASGADESRFSFPNRPLAPTKDAAFEARRPIAGDRVVLIDDWEYGQKRVPKGTYGIVAACESYWQTADVDFGAKHGDVRVGVWLNRLRVVPEGETGYSEPRNDEWIVSNDRVRLSDAATVELPKAHVDAFGGEVGVVVTAHGRTLSVRWPNGERFTYQGKYVERVIEVGDSVRYLGTWDAVIPKSAVGRVVDAGRYVSKVQFEGVDRPQAVGNLRLAIVAKAVAGTEPFKVGERVRLTDSAKQELAKTNPDHLVELAECWPVGRVEGLSGGVGPEYDVRWQPTGLRRMYRPEWLERPDWSEPAPDAAAEAVGERAKGGQDGSSEERGEPREPSSQATGPDRAGTEHGAKDGGETGTEDGAEAFARPTGETELRTVDDSARIGDYIRITDEWRPHESVHEPFRVGEVGRIDTVDVEDQFVVAQFPPTDERTYGFRLRVPLGKFELFRKPDRTSSELLFAQHELAKAKEAIKAMTEGSDGEVAAIIRMAVGLASNPDARLLLRHCAAQGERVMALREELKKEQERNSAIADDLADARQEARTEGWNAALDAVASGAKKVLSPESVASLAEALAKGLKADADRPKSEVSPGAYRT